MLKYKPYKSDKPDKIITILPMIIKKFILVKPLHLILQYIKMKQENKDILTDTRIMKTGQNLA